MSLNFTFFQGSTNLQFLQTGEGIKKPIVLVICHLNRPILTLEKMFQQNTLAFTRWKVTFISSFRKVLPNFAHFLVKNVYCYQKTKEEKCFVVCSAECLFIISRIRDITFFLFLFWFDTYSFVSILFANISYTANTFLLTFWMCFTAFIFLFNLYQKI